MKMLKRSLLGILLLASCWVTPAVAQQQPPVAGANAAPMDLEKPAREIFVPFEDLNVILGSNVQRVFMTRVEYQALVEKASQTPGQRPPQHAVLVSSNHKIEVEEGRARISSILQLEVLEDGLQSLPLALSGVALQAAELDGQPASLARDPAQGVLLLVDGKGRHTLKLELVTPIYTEAAQQTLQGMLPVPASTAMQIHVPGNVEIKSGARVLDRSYDEAANQTRFEILPRSGPLSIVMSLNNRRLQSNQMLIARGVIVDELTEAYERIHATLSLQIIQGVVDEFQLTVPAGFEVTRVTSPTLARWSVEQQEGGNQVLTAKLRDFISEDTVLTITANRLAPEWKNWNFPQLQVQGVLSQTSVLGVLVERRLEVSGLDSTNLIRLNNGVLQTALPKSIFDPEPGAPPIRLLTTYYAPQLDFDLSADVQLPESQLHTTTNLLLLIGESMQQVQGGFVLMPEVDDLFEFQFSVPADWQVTEVTDEQGNLLVLDETSNGMQRSMRVKLPASIPADSSQQVFFLARRVPTGWLDRWDSPRSVSFPRFHVIGADRDLGAIAVQVHDDFVVRPEQINGLTALGNGEKQKYGLGGIETQLAYYFDTADYDATITVERSDPLVTARSHSFFHVKEGALATYYELTYQVQRSRLNEVEFSLPETTPESLQIFGLNGVQVKQSSSRVEESRRYWTVLLSERHAGDLTVGIQAEIPLGEIEVGKAIQESLPIVRAEAVSYQSGVFSVEGSIDLEISITTEARRVDIGDLIAINYMVGDRLLGGYGFVGSNPEAEIDVERHPEYSVPSILVQRAEMVTFLSAQGQSQTVARYQLRTKSSYLQLALPDNSRLWAILVDNYPVRPQKRDKRILVSLSSQPASQLRDLRIVYSTLVNRVSFSGSISAVAPTLYVGTSNQLQRPVNIAELQWNVVLPPNYKMAGLDGSLVQVDRQQAGIGDRVDNVLGLFGSMLPAASARYDGVDSVMHAQSEESYSESPRPFADVGQSMLEDFKNGIDAESEMEPEESEAAEGLGEETPDAASPFGGDKEKPVDELAVPPAPAGEFGTATATPGDDAMVTKGAAVPAMDQGWAGVWALQGVRSLNVDLAENVQTVDDARVMRMRSLGVAAAWQVKLVNRQRLAALGILLGLAVVLVGLGLCGAPWRTRYRYIVGVLVASIALPALGIMTSLQEAWDVIFLFGLLLIPLYMIVPLFWWAATSLWTQISRRLAVTSCWLLLSLMMGNSLSAQEPAPGTTDAPVKVTVPADAIIIPYDPEKLDEATSSDRVLIPYDRYAALWKRAYPNRPLLHELLPRTYALAGSHFTTTLASGDSLLLKGYLDIDVFTDEEVAVPLALQGGVLRTATMDGQPARLQVLGEVLVQQQEAPSQQVANQTRQVMVPLAPPPPPTFLLLLKGKGRKRLEMTLALSITRQGGWRIVSGVLPVSSASSLDIELAAAKTELRWSGTTDRGEVISEIDKQQVNLSAGPGGALQFRWRPSITESMVDRSLTAESNMIVDVQEEAVHVVWDVDLQFRRGQRDIFQFLLPTTFQIEEVKGNNVRGWDVKEEEGQQAVTVELLEAAREQVQLQIHLIRHGAVGQEGMEQFDVPVIVVPDAMLHQGRVAIRRTPLINLRTESVEVVTRDDLNKELAQVFRARGDARLSPLGLQPYQTYRFSTTPFLVRLEATMLERETTASLQTLLRLAEKDISLESRIRVSPSRLAVHRVDIQIPEDFEVIEVEAPGLVDWSRNRQGEEDASQDILTVLLGSGHRQAFDVIVRGLIKAPLEGEATEIPRLSLLGMLRQQGQIVVQTDPSFDVKILELNNCQQQSLETVTGWLQAGQRSLARLVLSHRDGNYGGSVQLERREAIVHGTTFTNIRVTDRAIEETILLDFNVSNAGIDEIVFQLPAGLANARVNAPLLRRIERSAVVADDPESPLRVTIQLQDEVIGSIQVLVEHDRELGKETSIQHAPIPILETGQTDNRLVAIDSSGYEVTVETMDGLEKLSPQSASYQSLVNRMGNTLGDVFVVSGNSTNGIPVLGYKIVHREMRQLTSALVSLSEVTLVMDEQGSYRARQVYEMDNRTEQFLDLRLPKGSQLWVVQVGGQPVKPRQVPGQDDDRTVRIPIQRLAEGDAEFRVMLIYGGDTATLGSWGKVQFPFVEMVSAVNIEKTHVSLHLPETHRWYSFGGTTQQVQSYDELVVEQYKQRRSKTKKLLETINMGKDVYSLSRIQNNLKSQQLELLNDQQLQGQVADDVASELNLNYAANEELLREVEGSLKELRDEDLTRSFGNRYQWNQGFKEQDNNISRNAVQQLGQNFDTQGRQSGGGAGGDLFQENWFRHNGLAVESAGDGEKGKNRVDMNDPAKPGQPRRPMAKRPMATPTGNGASATKTEDAKKAAESLEPAQKRESQLDLYKQKLDADYSKIQEQNSQELGGIVRGDAISGGMGGGGGGMSGQAGGGFPFNSELPAGPADGPSMEGRETFDIPVTGLASLAAFEIPTRGQAFHFKTIGGAIEIEARHVDQSLTERGGRFGWLAGSLLGLLLLVQVGGRMARHRISGSVMAAVLFLYSCLLMLASMIPLLGLLLMLVSIAWIFWLYLGPGRLAAAKEPN